MNQTDTVACIPGADSAFGPIVRGCRDNFDFTFAFEQYFFSIAPSATLLLVSPFRLRVLWGKRSRVGGNGLKLLKLGSITLFAMLQLALVVLWATQYQSGLEYAYIAASALSFVASLALLALSYIEHTKSLRPSILLNAYLFFSLLFDAVMLRTMWLSTFNNAIRDTYTASLALKVVVLFFEAMEKRSYFDTCDKQRSPEESSGLYNMSLFWWLNSIIMRGFRHILTPNDLYLVDESMSSEVLNARFWIVWDTSSRQGKNKLIFVLLGVLKWSLLVPVIPRFVLIAFTFCQPLLVNRFLQYLQSATEVKNANTGCGLVGAYAIVYLGMAISSGFYWHRNYRCITMLRGTLVAAIYTKTTEIDITALDNSAAVTLMSTDVERIVRGLREVHELWANMIQIALATWLLERELGLACIAPVLVAAVSIVATIRLSSLTRTRQLKWVKQIQKRVGITSTMLGSMKGVKMSGLTEKMAELISNLRLEEIRVAKAFRLLNVYTSTIAQVPQMISPVVTFAAYTIIATRTNATLDATRLFTSLALLILLSQPLFYAFAGIMELMSAIGCFERIEKFLLDESRIDHRFLVPEPQTLSTTQVVLIPCGSFGAQNASSSDIELVSLKPLRGAVNSPIHDSDFVCVREGTFGWNKVGQPILQDITFAIKRSQLVFLVGPVASGKSTLLKALLGETPSSKGFVYVPTIEVAWCEQTPWLINASVQKNIIGFSDFDINLYKSVLFACDLEDDIASFPRRDDTIVGSKGISLSGGQKQRIAIARAVYARKAIVMFDDVFSGLDRKTEKNVSDRLLGPHGLFRRWGTTAIVATHAVNLLPYADHIIALGMSGSIQEQGTLSSLNAAKGYVHGFCLEHAQKHDKSEETAVSTAETASKYKPEGKQDVSQTEASGDSKRHLGDLSVYRYYFQSVGWEWTCVFMFFQICWVLFGALPNVWLERWTQANEAYPNQRIGLYLGVYAVLQVTGLLSAAVTCWVSFNFIAMKSGIQLHRTLLKAVISAPMSFFSKTDTGSITTRFSQDVQLIDGQLPLALMCVVSNLLICIAQALLIASATFYIALSFPALIAVFYIVQKYYLRTSRQLRLLDLEEKAPVYTQFLETLGGLTTIRAFSWQKPSITLNHHLIDGSQKPFYLLFMIQRWLTLVLDLITTALAILVVGIAVKMRADISPGFTGVSLTQIISFTGYMKLTVLFWTQLETSIGAVARIKMFSTDTEDENLQTQQPSNNLNKSEATLTPADWPSAGQIEISSASASYTASSPSLAPVLQNISLSIPAGSRTLIVGRTGSGKSSLLLALLRLLPLSSGKITIDGLVISTIPLSILRSRLNALGQDALFLPYQTIRLNLDPYSSSSDAEIIAALEKVALLPAIVAKGGLDAVVEGESWLSGGQKQLFVLARCMLRKSKVVLLDEVSSSVDWGTEGSVRGLLRSEFEGCTVLCVAHRVQGLEAAGFDRVLVMDGGSLVEIGSQEELMEKRGAFWRLCGGREEGGEGKGEGEDTREDVVEGLVEGSGKGKGKAGEAD